MATIEIALDIQSWSGRLLMSVLSQLTSYSVPSRSSEAPTSRLARDLADLFFLLPVWGLARAISPPNGALAMAYLKDSA